MDRRTFNKLAGMTAIGTLTTGELCAAENSDASEVVLEDDAVLAAFDVGSGALTRLLRKSTGWAIERRPELGMSFRILAPLPGRRSNFVFGEQQRAAHVEKLTDKKVHIEWDGLASEHVGSLPMSFSATITLENGRLTFEGLLTNNSQLTVETIDYPFLGDLNPPVRDALMTVRTARYDNLESAELYPHFADEMGYWGVDFPTKTRDSFYSLFCLIQSGREGLYIGMHDPTIPYFLQYTFEQHPGVLNNSAPFSGGGIYPQEEHIVPEEDKISGIPVHLEFRTCHFVFATPHSTKQLAPVVLQSYSGDWHVGVDLYKHWRATWYQEPTVPAWAREVHSWQQLQINSSEEEYRIPYNRLTEYGDDCVKYGVTAIQLVGWNHGGQDRGNPSQDIDPKLGTWKELHNAIAQIQAKGIRIVLFAKFPWADMTTEWYKKELYKYEATDPYGIRYQKSGDSYHTPTQLAGINNRQFAVMDFCLADYRQIAVNEFQKLLALNPSGWLYDEVCTHAPVIYSFNRVPGSGAPRYIYSGDLPLARQLRAEADKINSQFLFAGEGPQDWLTQYYPFSYFRGSSTPLERYIAPNAPIMAAVNGFDDREQLNEILMYRYNISYEPYNFKGHLSDFSLTLAYGQKIDVLRRRYKDYLWDAEFRDTLGARVSSDGAVRYSVFVTRSGKRSIVVVSKEWSSAIRVRAEIPKPGTLVVVTPENPDPVPTQGKFEVPARSAAVILEL